MPAFETGLAVAGTLVATAVGALLQVFKTRVEQRHQVFLERVKRRDDARKSETSLRRAKLEEIHQLMVKLESAHSMTSNQDAWCAGQTPEAYDREYPENAADLHRLAALIRTWFPEQTDVADCLRAATSTYRAARRHFLYVVQRNTEGSEPVMGALEQIWTSGLQVQGQLGALATDLDAVNRSLAE